MYILRSRYSVSAVLTSAAAFSVNAAYLKKYRKNIKKIDHFKFAMICAFITI